MQNFWKEIHNSFFFPDKKTRYKYFIRSRLILSEIKWTLHSEWLSQISFNFTFHNLILLGIFNTGEKFNNYKKCEKAAKYPLSLSENCLFHLQFFQLRVYREKSHILHIHSFFLLYLKTYFFYGLLIRKILITYKLKQKPTSIEKIIFLRNIHIFFNI